jgi:glycosyltransferase involved in cell wall biosynthesis
MKVLWICHFSNPQVREKLNLTVSFIEALARKLLKIPQKQWNDFAAWITNGIEEFEKFDDIELHVVSPHYGIKKRIDSFELNGIFYHFFKPDDDSIIKKMRRYISKNIESDYEGNRKVISSLIESINPDVIHMYGAENPYYSISALDIDLRKYPLMVSLQTLMSDSAFLENYPIDNRSYNFRSSIEQKIIKRIDYIGSSVQKYRQIIWSSYNPKAIFFKTYLAVEEKVDIINMDKKYDFVFFAASINKHADIAVEAFALASKTIPGLTLNIIGGTPEPFTGELKARINELGIANCVFFSGMLPTHQDVLKQIQLSRFAILPLKVDGVSGTIREAMFAGIPIVSTITRSTPDLNVNRESLLLSKQGDFEGMAFNMVRLVQSPELAFRLRSNALITAQEKWNNNCSMSQLIEVYKAIIMNHKHDSEIPNELGDKNPNVDYAGQNC